MTPHTTPIGHKVSYDSNSASVASENQRLGFFGSQKLLLSTLALRQSHTHDYLIRTPRYNVHELICTLPLLPKTFLIIFRTFQTTFRRFPTIFQNCSEGQSNVSEHFQTEDFQRLVKISEDGRKCFDQQYTKEVKWVKGTKVKCYQNDIFTREDIISSHVMISYHFHQFDTSRYTANFYIIKSISRKMRELEGITGKQRVLIEMLARL